MKLDREKSKPTFGNVGRVSLLPPALGYLIGGTPEAAAWGVVIASAVSAIVVLAVIAALASQR